MTAGLQFSRRISSSRNQHRGFWGSQLMAGRPAAPGDVVARALLECFLNICAPAAQRNSKRIVYLRVVLRNPFPKVRHFPINRAAGGRMSIGRRSSSRRADQSVNRLLPHRETVATMTFQNEAARHIRNGSHSCDRRDRGSRPLTLAADRHATFRRYRTCS